MLKSYDDDMSKCSQREASSKLGISHTALFNASLLGKENFADRWLARWKEQRNNIVYRKLHGKEQDADNEVAKNWKEESLVKLIKDYVSDQMFNSVCIFLYSISEAHLDV